MKEKEPQKLSKSKAFAEKAKETKLYKWSKKYIGTPLCRLYRHKFILCLVSAVVLNLLIELASRRSFSRLALHVIDNFHMFLFGCSIIAFTLCLSMLFKRRLFAYSVIMIIWICLGISNVCMLLNRSNPLMLVDFLILRSGMSLSTMYLSPWLIMLMVLGDFAAVMFFVWLFRSCPKEPVRYKRAIAFTLCIAVLAGGLAFVFAIYKVVSPSQRLPDDYDNCGFIYCLLYGIVDTGMSEPEVYDDTTMEEIKKVVDSVKDEIPEVLPNVIVLQLESFMDMYRLANAEYSEDPHPYFTELKKRYPNGMLTVNALGACTANVEYEILTGTDIRSYGFDEYPYLSYLQNSPMESAAYVLKNVGYTTTAIHNHNGGFYGRNEAYTNLGFDRYIPLEAFGELFDEDYTYSKFWARDAVIFDQIKGTIEKSDGADMIMTVTVQCHGKYHDEYLEDFEYPVEISGFEDNESYTNMLLYYAAMAREEDEFIKKLFQYLEELDEESVVIMYGDHLPTFVESSDQLKDYNDGENPNAKYNSEYVVWFTEGLKAGTDDPTKKDLYSYELLSYALDMAGIRTGNIMKLYHADITPEELARYRSVITYDILEGDNVFFGGKSPYETLDTEVGLTPMAISGYTVEEERMYIEGQGFTPFTELYINDGKYSSQYLSPTRMEITEEITLENGDLITAKLLTTDLKVLDVSEAYIVGDLSEGEKLTANEGSSGTHSTKVLGIVAAVLVVVVCITALLYFKAKRKKQSSSN